MAESRPLHLTTRNTAAATRVYRRCPMKTIVFTPLSAAA
jgi:hypothetical protein